MTKKEMDRRCEEAVNQIGKKTLDASVMLIAGLEYDLREWIHEGQENTEQLGRAIGQCYAALKMLEIYAEIDPNDINSGTMEVLSYV